MAPKNPLPSPSLKDDQKLSSKKQPEDKVTDEEEEDSSEEEENEEDQPQTPSKKPPPSTPISNPKPASESGTESGSDSGSGSESETDAKPEPTPPPKPKVKPLASKPIKPQPKTQTQAQTTSAPARSGTKRAAENGNDSNPSKKKKAIAVAAGGGSDDENETEEGVKLTGGDSKKSKPRVFTEEDEVTILNAHAEFISKTQTDPYTNAAEFHNFVKKSLSAECTVEQLKRKVRGLKTKYKTRGRSFKKVCGNDGANEAVKNGKFNGKTVKGVTKKASGSVMKATEKETVKVESDADTSLILTELFRFDAGLSASSKDLMKRGLELMEESKRVEMEEKWRQVQIAEVELMKKRSEVVTDYSNLILGAINKSSK